MTQRDEQSLDLSRRDFSEEIALSARENQLTFFSQSVLDLSGAPSAP